ncbi:hypothetical protein [Myxococcus eversor]|uniref:hypothetical protein n=1 Tax=Myxococcus eversor TaxID=2709661 RepID=UPI0013D37C95|nr:hypothetical protein [Myxococcus eversor]
MSLPSSRPPRGIAWLRSCVGWCLGASSLAVVLTLGVAMLSAVKLVLSEVSWLPADTSWVSSPLPLHGQLPRFELQDADGAPFGTRQLRGRAYVLQLPGDEPPSGSHAIVTRLSSVERRLEAERLPLRFVVVTRQPLDVVSTSSPASWKVLAEDVAWGVKVLALLREGVPARSGEGGSSLMRSTLLVDQAGGLRGVYDLTSSTRAVDALVADARQVFESGPVPALAGLPMAHPHVLGVGCVGERGRH